MVLATGKRHEAEDGAVTVAAVGLMQIRPVFSFVYLFISVCAGDGTQRPRARYTFHSRATSLVKGIEASQLQVLLPRHQLVFISVRLDDV